MKSVMSIEVKKKGVPSTEMVVWRVRLYIPKVIKDHIEATAKLQDWHPSKILSRTVVEKHGRISE